MIEMGSIKMIPRVDFARRLLVLTVALASALSCTGPHGSGRVPNVSKLEIDNWHELRSADFILYSRGSREHLETFAVDLARYVAVVEQLVRSQPPKAPAQIFLVEDRASTLFIPHPSIGGYMDHSLAGFGGFMRGATHDPTYRNLLLHEYSHYLHLRSSDLTYPNWYTEGFAEFLGSTRTRDDVMEVGSAPPWILLQLEHRRLRKEEIDLATIFSFERDGTRPDPSDFYPISWAVVHYLSSNAARHRQMLAMLNHQSAGLHWKRAYDRSFSESIESLSSRVSRHAEMLSRGTPSAVSYLPLDSLEVRDHWEIREVPQQEILQLFGEAALRNTVYLSGGKKANMLLAEALFRRAIELDPDDSKSRAGLAAALSAQSKFDEAETQLVSFREDPEPSVASIVHAADALRWHAVSLADERDAIQREQLLVAAIRLYQTALDAQPKDAFALAGLGYSQLEAEDFTAARRSLADARRVGEWDAQLTLSQGLVEKQLGSIPEASSFWKEVIRLGTEEEAKRAATLLDKVHSK
jgi:tetratricopeptide (TPR) repeat protein